MAPPNPDIPTSPEALADFARNTSLAYGTWGRFKQLYKDAEKAPNADPALFAALAARIDAAPLTAYGPALPVEMGPGIRGISSLAVTGRRLYCLLPLGSSAVFAGYEFDPADPLHPKPTGKVEAAGASAVLSCGPFIGLLGAEPVRGLLSVFDPTDLNQPRWRGSVSLGGESVAVSSGSFVYAAVHTGHFSGLRIADLSDPDKPRIAGELAIKDAQFVACDGALIVVSSGATQFQWGQTPGAAALHFIDVSDPSRPRLRSTFSLSSAAIPISAVALRGDFAYVGGDRADQYNSAGLYVVDVSNPTRPVKRGFCSTHYYAPQSITLNGDFAYVPLQYGSPEVINISNPDAPANAGELSGYGAASLAVSEGTLYFGTHNRGLELYNALNPGKPSRIGTPPSGATFGYMKRRVRRALRGIAKTNPDSYVPLAAEVLGAVRPGEFTPFDPAKQWVVADILHGGGDRYRQTRHGRGPLLPTLPAKRRFRTREERASDAWNRRPDLAAALLANPALPWPIHEAMLKIALAQKTALPAFSPETLSEFVFSPSPLLIHFAVPAVASRLERGETMPPRPAASAFVSASRKWRRVIETALDGQSRGEDWNRAFAVRVFTVADEAVIADRLPRRFASACEAVAKRFPTLISDDFVHSLAAPLLSANRSALSDLVLTLLRRVSPPDVYDWLELLQPVTEAGQEQAILALALGLTSHAFTFAEAQALVLRGQSEFIRAAGWRLLDASRTDGAVFQALWTTLLDSPTETPALRTAMLSPAALAGLARAGLSPQVIASSLADRPFLAALLAPTTFASILPSVPVSVGLSLVSAVTDDRWPEFRPSLRAYLNDTLDLAAFWISAASAVAGDAEGRLERRLLDDAEIADTLLLVNDPELLSIREPAFEGILTRWCEAHAGLFLPDTGLLLEAATHVLAGVRTWALDKVREVGQTLPFALRLLESGLPASVEVGAVFFNSILPGAQEERGYALALCDSPFAPVRTLGQTFVTGRWQTLPQEALLSALFENLHSDMQAFAAELLGQTTGRPAGIAGFDSGVLRTRHASRRAKEAVKARQSVEVSADVPTLLALARSRTPRDSEWALGQLAKLALAGQEIEGFTVVGVSGG